MFNGSYSPGSARSAAGALQSDACCAQISPPPQKLSRLCSRGFTRQSTRTGRQSLSCPFLGLSGNACLPFDPFFPSVASERGLLVGPASSLPHPGTSPRGKRIEIGEGRLILDTGLSLDLPRLAPSALNHVRQKCHVRGANRVRCSARISLACISTPQAGLPLHTHRAPAASLHFQHSPLYLWQEAERSKRRGRLALGPAPRQEKS